MQKERLAQLKKFQTLMMVIAPSIMLIIGLFGDFYPFSSTNMFSDSQVPFSGYLIKNNETGGIVRLNRYFRGRIGYFNVARYIEKNLRTKTISGKACEEMRRKFLQDIGSFSILEFNLYPNDLLTNEKPEPVWQLNCPR
jgi:hypothetical protein